MKFATGAVFLYWVKSRIRLFPTRLSISIFQGFTPTSCGEQKLVLEARELLARLKQAAFLFVLICEVWASTLSPIY